MSAVTCPSCKTPAEPGAIFCDNCGFDLRNVTPAAVPPTQVGWAPPAPTAGVVCAACSHNNVSGAAFCENCGAQLPQGPAAQPPIQQPPAQQPPYQPPVQQPPPYQAPVQQPPYQAPVQQPPYQAPVQQPPYTPPVATPAAVSGRLVIQGSNVNLAFPQGKQAVLIGREDPVSGIFPEVDLDQHGGQEAGVGRQHARLTAQGGQVFIEDLNSVNGTAVNKQKLPPGQPRPLNSGDELRLGKMVLIYYSS